MSENNPYYKLKPEIKALYDEHLSREIIKNFGDNIEKMQEDINPEFTKIINKNFEDLIE